MTILKGSESPTELLHRMTLLGMVTPQQKQEAITSLRKSREFCRRYFEYREDPDRIIFICKDEEEQSRMLDIEARLGGVPFSMSAKEAAEMHGDGEDHRRSDLGVYEESYLRAIANIRLSDGEDRTIEGFYKR